MNAEGGHPWLGIGERGRAVCLHHSGAWGDCTGTSNYSTSQGSSTACMQMQASQVSWEPEDNQPCDSDKWCVNRAVRSPSQTCLSTLGGVVGVGRAAERKRLRMKGSPPTWEGLPQARLSAEAGRAASRAPRLPQGTFPTAEGGSKTPICPSQGCPENR